MYAPLTEAERQQVIDTGRHVYGCCANDCPDHGLPEDAQLRLVARIKADAYATGLAAADRA